MRRQHARVDETRRAEPAIRNGHSLAAEMLEIAVQVERGDERDDFAPAIIIP